eukprot:CAMPEP_0168572452 /NCGR_PEP_ID=MMETSP0413-20121227/17946_1 /TAXON_ID=136452 /ORGANISM="Filamoeba nolandi, Strain NC-AS-23-1" /LENGTH=331 /DNA_ID=CAMNT_0008605511 /DNA_START=97 /DNA_END=1093 /DNA_ORIENTATION=-
MSDPRARGKPDRGYGPVRDHGVRKSGPYQRDGEKKEKERPSRTLFIRNIDYSVSGDELQKICEAFGQIKKFFPLIEKRGMTFVTYFDSRDAERARKDLQDRKFNGRPVDVHYALPKDTDAEQDENTGTLFVTVRNASSPPDNHEIRTFFEQWGQIREVAFQKFVEYYDLRDSEKAYTEAQDKSFQDGYFDIRYAFLQGSKDKKEPRQDRSPPRNQNPPPLPMSGVPLQAYPGNIPLDLSSLAVSDGRNVFSAADDAPFTGLPNVPLQQQGSGYGAPQQSSYQPAPSTSQYSAALASSGGTGASANTAQLQQLMALLLQQQQTNQQQQQYRS